MTKRKPTSNDTSRFRLMLFGTLGSIILFFVISFVFSLISLLLNDPLGIVGIISIMALILCSIVSSFVISRIGGAGGAFTAILSALLFSLIMLLLGLALSGGKMHFGCIVNYLIYMAVSSVSAYFARPRARIKRRRA